jgi:hypothetical protein
MQCPKFLCPKYGYTVLLNIGARVYKGKHVIYKPFEFSEDLLSYLLAPAGKRQN